MNLTATVVALLILPPALAAAEPVKFMGVETKAGTAAFVCDASRWTKAKIDDLSEQLIRAVDEMSPDQRFAMIFFADDKAFGPEEGRAMPATPENKQKLRDWLNRVPLGDRSTPAAGLKRAFESNPGAVFFVSSGEFDDYDGVAAEVERLNRNRVARVHAIGFFETKNKDDSRSFVRFMKQLAEDNGGELKLVYADELKRR